MGLSDADQVAIEILCMDQRTRRRHIEAICNRFRVPHLIESMMRGGLNVLDVANGVARIRGVQLADANYIIQQRNKPWE